MPRSKSVQSKKAPAVAGETKPPEPAKQEGSGKPAAEQRGHAKQMKQGDDVPPKVPVTAVFSFLKDTRGAVTWTADDLARTLKVKKHEAEKVLSVLELQGYVHRSGEDEWLTTAAGESVSGSKAPRFAREAVEEALTKLSERIAEINEGRDSEFEISEAVAFGDFLAERPKCQAADVGIELENKRSGAIGDEAKELEFLKNLGRNRLPLHIRRYEKWMSERTHRRLLP